MKKLILFLSAALFLLACGEESRHVDANDVTLKFTSTWNIYEKCGLDENENVIYNGIPWGGLVGNFLEQNMPSDPRSQYQYRWWWPISSRPSANLVLPR